MVSDTLARNVVTFWGEAGARWLDRLPAILVELAAEWELTIGPPFDLSIHYVTAATLSDRTPVVLKLGVPGGGSLDPEAAALHAFAGRGAVRLLRADLARGALLLDRVTPGGRLRDLVRDRDTEATAAAIVVLRRLRITPPPGCPLSDLDHQLTQTFKNYIQSYGAAGPLPLDLVNRAAGLARELCASAPERVVLHGDLHHDNILRSTRDGWLAIDPHGGTGDPGYDIGALLYNPAVDDRDAALTALVPARVEQLAEGLSIPVDRVVAWGFVKAVLSEVWSTGDPRFHPGRALDVARLLAPRLG